MSSAQAGGGPPTPPRSAASPPRPGLVVARVGSALGLLLAALVVLRPFLVPMAWAAILAYATWPLYRRARDRTRRPRGVAALFTVAIAIGVGGPVAWLLVNLANEANQLARALDAWLSSGTALPDWVARREWLADGVERLRAMPLGDVGGWIGRHGAEVSRRLVDVAGGIARNVFKFGVAMVTLYFFYKDGDRIATTLRELALLLFPVAPRQFVEGIGDAVRGVLFGVIGTALAQALLAGGAYAAAGIPAPFALGAATFVLSFVPAGPTSLALAAALWLFLQERVGWAVGIALWGVFVIGMMDNVLRPILISGPTRIPFLLVFVGAIGGLAAMGLIGIFVGPVLLSVAFTLIVRFARLASGGDADQSGSTSR